jgi:hypothetical protein
VQEEEKEEERRLAVRGQEEEVQEEKEEVEKGGTDFMRIRSIIAATAVCALAAPAAASADTVVMGSTLANDFEGGISTAPTVSAQLSFDPATSTNPVVSPVDGVITGWKVKSADDGALYTLKILRPNGPVSLVNTTNSNFTSVASVAAPSPVPAGTGVSDPTGVIFDYPGNSLPIKKGDYIGLLSGGAVDGLPQDTTDGLAQNIFSNNFAGLPTDGTSADLLSDVQHDLLLQATIEYTPEKNSAGKKCKKKKKKKGKAGASAKKKKKKCKKKKKKK